MVDFRVDGSASLDSADIIESVEAIIAKLDELADKIEEVDAAVDELSGKTIELDVEINGEDKLEFLKDLLDDLESKTYVVRIEVQIDGEEKLEALGIQVDSMSSGRKTVGMDVDVQGADRATTELVALDEELNSKENDFKKAKDSSDGFNFSLLALLPVFTAIIPVLAAAGAGAVALAGAFAVMVPGLAGVFLAAKPAEAAIQSLTQSLSQNTKNAIDNANGYDQVYSILEKNSAQFRTMSPELQDLAANWYLLQNAYTAFQKSVDPEVFIMLNQGMQVLRTLLSGLPALVKPAAEALQSFILDFADRLSDPVFQSFFSDMKKNTYAFVSDWGEGVLNIVEGIAAILHAFMPLSVDVSNGFLNMSESFDKWAQSLTKSQGFQSFVSYVKTNGPVVLDVLKQLVLLLANVGTALSGMGSGSLDDIDKLLQGLNKMAQTSPGMFKLATTLLLVGVAGSKLVSMVGPLLAFLATPAGAIIAVIIGLGAAFMYAYTHSKTFHDWVVTNLMPMWDKIVAAAQGFVTWIKGLMPDIIEIWDKYGKTFEALVTNLWNLVGGIFQGAIKIIEGVVDVFVGLLTGNWTKVKQGIISIVEGLWQMVETLFTSGVKAIGDIFSGAGEILWNVGVAIIQGLWGGMKNLWNQVTGWLSSIGGWIQDLKGPLDKDKTLLEPHGKAIIGGLMSGMQSQMGPLETQLKGFAKTIENTFGSQYTTGISTDVSAQMGQAASNLANYQQGGRLPGAAGAAQVNFAANSIVVNNAVPETAGTTLTRVLQGAAKFGTVQAPVGYSTGT